MSSDGGYRIIDEIEPVSGRSFALDPRTPLIAIAILPSVWACLMTALNSQLLGHPKRRQHWILSAQLAASVQLLVWVIKATLPRTVWPYCGLLIIGVRLGYVYYMAEEQEWAADMFKEAGGKLASFPATLAAILLLSHIVERFFGMELI